MFGAEEEFTGGLGGGAEVGFFLACFGGGGLSRGGVFVLGRCRQGGD
jgi:hypothetical protein